MGPFCKSQAGRKWGGDRENLVVSPAERMEQGSPQPGAQPGSSPSPCALEAPASLGCHAEFHRLGRLKQQTFSVSWFWSTDVLSTTEGRADSTPGGGSLPGMQMLALSLCPRTRPSFPSCASRESPLSGVSSYRDTNPLGSWPAPMPSSN